MKALVGAFNQELLVGAFSVIVKTGCGTDGALHSTNCNTQVTPHCTQPSLHSPLFLSSGAGLRSLIVHFGLWNVKVGGWSIDTNYQDSVLDVEVWFLINLCLFQKFQQTPLLFWLLSCYAGCWGVDW